MSNRPKIDLEELAWRAMRERGLEPDFPPDVQRQVAQLRGPAEETDPAIRDLRALAWVSIDNDDSRDLDQLSVAEDLGGGSVRVLVAIADVDALVKKDSPVDRHAEINTTSVYTSARIFPMLPERLSTDLTSLNQDEDRIAVIIAYVVQADGAVDAPEIYRARVRNKAKLAYNGVTAWLEGKGPMPEALAAAEGTPEQIRLQDQVAERLRARRDERGALDLETIEPKAVVRDGIVLDFHYEPQNRAQKLIEDFMIAANGVTAEYLEQRGFPTLRRVVRSPERWDRIERLAAEYGFHLPPDPDSRALAKFLIARRRADPLRFPDLSLSIVKMLGAGEYVVQMPGEEPVGHFGLAVRDYSHSTAPNRRYPDLITQRLLKAALHNARAPYQQDELEGLAEHCTEQEDAANKVERQMRKSAAALLLADRIGDRFDAIVTGVTHSGTWVRILQPPAEGMLVSGRDSLDVGDRLMVKLVDVNVERGFIDFVA
ncbi:MAG TPA: RNB domain-containing ribonuclease [Chthonomonadaceae bacterium]|nr:RNB domain-containing ribonuclease [Chthonomonadaceae bacterium]